MFFDELSRYLSEPFSEMVDYKYYVISNKIVCVSGYKKLISCTKEMVSLGVKHNVLCIEGIDMRIKELDKSSIVIVGNISRVYLLNEKW